jgi:hypothetical protein
MFNYFNYFYQWIEDNPDKVDPYITAVYFALLNRANKSGWKDKFAIILVDLQETCGINSRTTMLKTLSKLEDFGFLQTVSTTQNQYKNRVICLPLNEKHLDSTWKPNEKHVKTTWTHNKTIKTLEDSLDCLDNLPDSNESNPVTIQTDSIELYTPEPEKKKVAPKKKSTNHRFAESIYANDFDQFQADWQGTETSRTYPDTDPLKVYTTLKTASDANDKYKYSNWIAAAQNWVKRNPAEYKRTFTTPSGQQLHHNDQAIIDRVERLTRDYIGIQPPEY